MWHLGSLFYYDSLFVMQGDLHICFGMLLGYETLCTGLHHFLCTCTLCPFSGCGQLKMAAEFAGFHWPVLVMVALKPHNICRFLTWSFNQSGVGQSWLLSTSSITFLTTKSLKSQLHLPPLENNRSNCWVLLDPEGGKTISWSTWSYINLSKSCWPCDQNCRCNPCAGYTVTWCKVSQGGCCHHRNFLLLVVGACWSACKLLIFPSKLMRSNLPWSSSLHHPFSVSVVSVQSPGPCLFCWAILSCVFLFYIQVIKKVLAMKRNCP